uniref:Ankyrin repeat domain-containing protein 37 n=1 Tax=Canis lupus familiaris TaxID=9615 RepID=A0A8P0PKN6_CANLF
MAAARPRRPAASAAHAHGRPAGVTPGPAPRWAGLRLPAGQSAGGPAPASPAGLPRRPGGDTCGCLRTCGSRGAGRAGRAGGARARRGGGGPRPGQSKFPGSGRAAHSYLPARGDRPAALHWPGASGPLRQAEDAVAGLQPGGETAPSLSGGPCVCLSGAVARGLGAERGRVRPRLDLGRGGVRAAAGEAGAGAGAGEAGAGAGAAVLPPQVDGVQHLLEAGASVNAPPDPCEQAPVHLAAGGGLACFLLWQLQSGADLNQQDVFGEAPLHKAAKVGSLECLSLLVASDAQIDLCNKNGQTAEDLAWACGFLECAKFLTTIKCMQTIKSSDRSDRDHCVPVLRQKRSFGSAENTTGKRKC